MTDISPRAYYVLVFRDAHRYYPYRVLCPDFDGWSLDLKDLGTLDDIHRRVAESLLKHIEDTGESPDPTPADLVLADEDGVQRPGIEGALILPVTVGTRSQVRRVNITIDAYLLFEGDTRAKEMGLTRSALMSEALRRLLRGSRS
jgi:hypothetical protein